MRFRQLNKAGLLAPLAALTSSPAIAQVTDPAPSNQALYWLGVSVVAVCAGLVATRLRAQTAPREPSETEKQLAHEVRALNAHAIVLVADSRMRIVHVNDRFVEASGFTRSELVGRPTSWIYLSNDQKTHGEICRHIFDGKTWSGETRLRCKDGTYRWTQTTIIPRLDENGKVIGTVGIRTDITASKTASEERDIVSALHRLSDAVVMFSADSFRILYLNETAMSLLDWNEARYPTKRMFDIDFEHDPDEVRSVLQKLVNGTANSLSFEIRLSDRPFLANLQLVRPAAGEARFVAILRDLSEREEMDRAKNEFISTVSHELRSPLTSIKGAMGLVLSGAAGEISPKAAELVEIAHRNADRLVLIVNDILDLEKIAAGRMEFTLERHDLMVILREARAANNAYAERFQVKISVRPPAAPAWANVDADRILQVLTNLLSNAAKFSRPGSEILATVSTEGGRHTVSVTDRGVGIPQEALATIFERFQQVDNPGHNAPRGSGLGLSIVKAIVESHGGSVSVDSTPGEGTTVSFTLDDADADAAAPDETPPLIAANSS
ncbi:two-component hybrid sensor and regulator [Oceanicola granulosus HTCC2516]|uniref:histidine kinase n=1 Tax=Oceanicola granulosus (strain ATCC BAA-861 / DSM 15982 / KCTC 12143 / HTCC2516) TaxID=314256 RepID=Q2CCA9_OCEGH|nr:ATP-binding protein [Oceanicola granulosus]EAR50324.1 two-component hybrid sensor and regulator [Oceanicola granulosus HTCC2516]